MQQLAFTGLQPLADLPQGLRSRQLAEKHGDELSPAGETARVSLGLMFFDEGLELQPRETPQKLTENAAYSIQGGASW
jgi:hypothetical protein